MHSGRRSKTKLAKTSSSNIKTVEVGRGPNGYGFTMTGQYPCVLSTIMPGSPADIAGLTCGDCVVAINGENVTRVGHEQIIKVIGSVSGVLRLTVAGMEESDSSDDDYTPAPRMRYSRSKSTTPTANYRTETDKDDFKQQRRVHGNIDKTPAVTDSHVNKFAPGHLSPYNRSGKASLLLKRPPSSYDFMYWNGRSMELIGASQKPRRVKRQSESKPVRQRAYSAQSHSSYLAEGEEESDQGLQPLTPAEVSSIMYPSHLQNTRPGIRQSKSASGKERRVLTHAVVGYLGSIDIPASANLPTASLQAIRGCVRRLHLEQRVHSLMLMEITNSGVELINANQRLAVIYPSERITFSGVCPDDKRCFGIVTAQSQDENVDSVDSDDEPIGSSCHVFIVDPSLSYHNVHLQMAARFGVQCIHDAASNTCKQFPTSSRPLLTHISQLHRDHGDSLHFADFYGQSLYAPGPRRSESNSSNSDSGFGNGKENGTEPNQHAERVAIVDVAGHIRSQRRRAVLDNAAPDRHIVQAEINTSRSSYSLSSPSSSEYSPQIALNHSKFLDDPSGRLTPRARPDPILTESGRATPLATATSAILNKASGRLTPRARPDPVGFGNNTSRVASYQDVSKKRPHLQDASPRNLVSETIAQLQNRQSGATGVKNRAPSARHSMYARSNMRQRHQEENQPDKKAEVEWKQKTSLLHRLGVPRHLDLARHNSDCSDYSSPSRKASDQKVRRSQVLSQEADSRMALTASDGELDVNEEDSMSKSEANRSNPNLVDLGDGQEIGRVSRWAVNFDCLLQDELGLACFTEFLKREFSEENIMFWIACETMSKMTKEEELKRMADHIYTKHLSDEATMPVNLDSSCRSKVCQALKSPTPEMFRLQQQQIFRLMKYDSYSRFLKSQVYQDCVLAEMAGNPIPISFTRQRSEGSASSAEEATGETKKTTPKGNKKKYQIWRTSKPQGLDVNEESPTSPDKKKKLLLPWNRVKGVKKFGKDAESSKEQVNVKTSSRPTAADCKQTRKAVAMTTHKPVNEKTIPLEGTCRLIFPNDDIVVLPARQGFTVHEILQPHLEVRQLHLQTVETFLAHTKEIVDYQQDMSAMAGADIVVEQRVIFKMELPNSRVITVKSKLNKKLLEVLKPVTYRYNLQLDDLVVHLSNSPVPLDLDITVASLDGQRILIETLEQYGAGNYQVRASVEPSRAVLTSTQSKIHKSSSAESFIPKQESRPVQAVKIQRRHSENGSQRNEKSTGNDSSTSTMVEDHAVILRPSNSDTSVQTMKSQNRNYRVKNGDADELYKMLSKAQRRRMDDQRGLTIRNLDLPDFLKTTKMDQASNKRPKSALSTPYQHGEADDLQGHEKNLRFYDMAMRCKSTPPAPFNREMGLWEGLIPSHSQADAVLGQRWPSGDVTTHAEEEAANGDSCWDGLTHNGVSGWNMRFQTYRKDNDKFSPRAYPDNFLGVEDPDARTRGYSLEIYDATLADNQSNGEHHAGVCTTEENIPGNHYTDVFQKPENGTLLPLPPPPDNTNHTLDFEEANYSPPPPVFFQSLDQDQPNTFGRNGQLLMQTDGVVQGSTLPGHTYDFSNQPLTDTDTVNFGDRSLTEDPFSPRPPSPSTHDLVMPANSEENDSSFTAELDSPPRRYNHPGSNLETRPDILGSQNLGQLASVSKLQQNPVLAGTSQHKFSSNLTSQNTLHPNASQGAPQPSHTYLITKPLSTASQHSRSQTSVSQSIPSQSLASSTVCKQGTSTQWRTSNHALQSGLNKDKWETVVKDGRSMRATFV